MARYTSNSMLNSLKGKIWLAAGALAFFTCTFGLIAYLIISFVVNDPFFGVLIPFLLLALTVIGFGWWLANEVVSPIEKVALLARSLERSATTTLPKTSGSSETDELLETLHRSSLQMQKLVGLMEEVASGNTNVALTPLQSSDRLTAAFQRLLAKVTDSIDARATLDNLQRSVNRLTDEVARVRNHNLDAEFTTDNRETREIAETLRFLVQNLNDLVTQVRGDSGTMKSATADARHILQYVIQQDENKIQEMNMAALVLQEIPSGMQKIAANFSGAVESANRSIEKARAGSETAHENVQAAAVLRRQLHEAMSRIGRLGERVQEIGKIARTVGDLAHRTNTIALNASIQASELGEHGRGFTFVADEIERLATRADSTNKQITLLNKEMSSEINEVERALQTTFREAAGLSNLAVETGHSLGEIEKHVSQILNLQKQLNSNSAENVIETERAFHVFVGAISDTEMAVEQLRLTEKSIAGFGVMIDNMLFAVEDYKLPQLPEPDYHHTPSDYPENIEAETPVLALEES